MPSGTDYYNNGYENYDQDFWSEQRNGKRRRPRRRPVLPLVLLAAFLAVAIGGFLVARWWLDPGSGEEDGGGGEALASLAGGAADPNGDLLYLLLLGIDQRDHEAARADTMMLAVINRHNREAALISIPRDTRAEVPGHGMTKINHAHAYGGPDLTLQAVSKLLGIEVNKYVEVNFQGFEAMVDTLGGVDLEVEKRMYYPAEDIDLEAGLQHLDGDDALAYVRYRNDAAGDIGRVERQRKLLSALADQVLQIQTVARLPQLAEQVSSNLTTNLTLREKGALVALAGEINLGTLKGVTLPGETGSREGVSYWEPDLAAARQFLTDFSARKVQ